MPATPARAKKPQDRKPKQQFGKKTRFDLALPSGNEIVVTRPGLQGLIKLGILESMDSLTSIVQTETIPKAEGRPVVSAEQQREIVKDPSKLARMVEIMNKIAVAVVVEPELHTLPEDGEEDENLAYVEYVSDEDKTFIMNFALGGSADLASFREESQAALGSVPDVQADGDEA